MGLCLGWAAENVSSFSNQKGNREVKTGRVLGMKGPVSGLLRMVISRFSDGQGARTLRALGKNGPVRGLLRMVITRFCSGQEGNTLLVLGMKGPVPGLLDMVISRFPNQEAKTSLSLGRMDLCQGCC